MCGRFTSTTSAADLAAYFDADAEGLPELGPNHNVTPTSDVYIVREESERRLLDIAHWGLVPQWAESPAIGSRLINARSETAASKPSFRAAFRRRRCIVPVDGFYEWIPVPGQRKKQPFHLRRRDSQPLAFAGLWESWRSTDRPDEPALRSCTILTGPPNATVAPLHDRMPMILSPEHWAIWLDPDLDDPALLQSLLVPAPDDLLEAWPVSLAVNDVHRHDAALVERIEVDVDDEAGGQGRLL